MTHNWKRYWTTPDAVVSLADQGFLAEPGKGFIGQINPDLRTFDEIAQQPCLILLGEPGMGKTKTLQAEAERVTAVCVGTEDEVLYVDLGSTRDEPTLRNKIFGSQVFDRWRDGDGILHLFLDSLDEAVLRLGVVADLLLEGLRVDSVDIPHLRLRLACRTADRLRGFEEELSELWGEKRFGVFELAPLTQANVRLAASDRNHPPDVFIADLLDRDIVPLAIKPITLNFLLDAAEAGGSLPTDQVDLYDRGLRKLVSERERRQRDPQTRGEVDVGRRLAIASRIAGTTVLTGRPTIVCDAAGELSSDHVLLRQLAGGQEQDQDLGAATRFEVTTVCVEEVLNTGLFSARGNDLGWAHQTYGEFLAARYLVRSGLGKEQVLLILVSPGDPAGRIAPQLRDVAAWAATMDGELADELALLDPLVLLRGDIGLADNARRARLTSALLRVEVAEELDKWDPRVRRNLSHLQHPALAGTLRECLRDQSKPQPVRELAAEIAERAKLIDLQEILADLALDPAEPLRLRTAAVRTLDKISDDDTRRRLVPLARDSQPEDTDDELKGSALRAVCPRVLSAIDTLALLTPQKRENLYGAYAAFMRHNLPDALSADELPTALAWVNRLPRQHHPTDELSGLAEAILVRAWEEMEVAGVLPALADVVVGFVEGSFEMQTFRTRDETDAFQGETRRRRLVEAMLPAVRDGRLDPWNLVFSRPTLLRDSDLPWLADRLREAVDTEDEETWAKLIVEASQFRDADLDPVMQARETSPVLREMTLHLFGPIELNGELAATMRERKRHSDEREASKRAKREAAPDMDARIDFCLDRFEGGDLDGFWHLNLYLSVEQGRRHWGVLGSDLTAAPGWQRAPAGRRARIVAAAIEYVTAFVSEDGWFDDPSTQHRPSQAGYRALRLLSEKEGSLEGVNAEILTRWIPAMLSFPLYGGDQEDEEQLNEKFLATAYERCPDTLTELLCRRVRAESQRDDGHLSVLRRVRNLVDDDLGAALLRQWRDEDMQPQPEEDLLGALLRAGIEGASDAAEERLTRDLIDRGDEGSNRAVRIATALLAHQGISSWAHVWGLIMEHPDWGARVLETLAGDHDATNDVRRHLDEAQLTDLFLWLSERYPRDEDPDHTGTHLVGPREEITEYRDRILSEIASRGTNAAVEALQQIEEATGLYAPLLRVQAEEARRTRSWDPPRPEDIIALAADARRRIVLSEADLQRVVLESLDRAQEKLVQRDAHLLWDTASCQPKGETEIASWIASHLRDDLHGRGIIINREVEVRVNPLGGVGDRTDIHVDALAGELVEGAECVTVVIEVKGCWNNELRTAMQMQLAEKYLPASGTQHGIYLPVWFTVNDRWTENWRRTTCGRLDRDEVQKALDNQAEALLRERAVNIAARILDGTLV